LAATRRTAARNIRIKKILNEVGDVEGRERKNAFTVLITKPQRNSPD
jgi:hypothetical protein